MKTIKFFFALIISFAIPIFVFNNLSADSSFVKELIIYLVALGMMFFGIWFVKTL